MRFQLFALLSGCLALLLPSCCGGGARCRDSRMCQDDYDIERFSELDAAMRCARVTGDLKFISEAWLVSIDLPCLESVDGDLAITQNAALPSLDGLSSLKSVGGTLTIWDNDSLTSLDGLSHLESVGGHMHISRNACLSPDLLTWVGRQMTQLPSRIA